MDGVVDLLGREYAAAHRHAVSVEDLADRSPSDAEPFAELVHRRAGPVALDQTRPGINTGKLVAELFQRSELVFMFINGR